MKNIIIVKNELIILPYISDIGNIQYGNEHGNGNRFEFSVYSMVGKRKIISSKNLYISTKWAPVFTKIFPTLNDLETTIDKIKLEHSGDFYDGQMDMFISEYLKLQEIRNKLLLEWDKVLNNIQKI
jgi:hypothetical protein